MLPELRAGAKVEQIISNRLTVITTVTVIDTELHLCQRSVKGFNAFSGPGRWTGYTMTSTSEQGARHVAPKDRSRLTRNLFNTLPIVLVGSMAMSMNVPAPIQSVDTGRADKPKSIPSELGKSIRDAFLAATRAATNPVATVVSAGAMDVVAYAPATYLVAAGDTISSIAGRHGLATASVLALNGLGWKSVIFPGQVLRLTSGKAVPVVAAPTIAATTRYTIQTGDTIGGIAARFRLSTQTLLSANGLGWASIIYPGQTVAIPGASSVASLTPAVETAIVETPTPAEVSYVIAIGDTISSIAAKFGVSAQAVLTANGLGWSSIIYTGRALVIPRKATVAVASADTVIALTGEMATNAKIIIRVGRSLHVSDYGLVIALAAAAQESGMRNLNYGDRDSLGLFQQRPSAGWGTPARILDPTYAAKLFFGGPSNPNLGNTRGLLEIDGWQSKSVTQSAQAVQLSAFPLAYAKWETSARAWLAALR